VSINNKHQQGQIGLGSGVWISIGD